MCFTGDAQKTSLQRSNRRMPSSSFSIEPVKWGRGFRGLPVSPDEPDRPSPWRHGVWRRSPLAGRLAKAAVA